MTSGTVSLDHLTTLVRAELEQMNRGLSADLRPEQADLLPLVELASGYRGKQLRPALVFLCGKLCGELSEAHQTVGKVVELLHTATLVHDDVLDEASIRRQTPTVNALDGTEIPVLLGDYIYARAFHLSVQLEDPTCSRVLAEVTRRICQGEITQILHRFDFSWDQARYFQVITEKTALLYGAACRLGAHYAGARQDEVTALDQYGTALGVAFQIVDDCLDLRGDESVVGKSLGTDLRRGKLTLPLLYLKREASVALRLRELMETDLGEPQMLEHLRKDFDLDSAIDEALVEARRRVAGALEILSGLPLGPSRDALAALGEYVITRRL